MHPTVLYESLVDRKIYSYAKSQLDGRGFYAIDSAADIENKWRQFLETKPDFVKLYLLHSEAYDQPGSTEKPGGLRPEFVPEIPLDKVQEAFSKMELENMEVIGKRPRCTGSRLVVYNQQARGMSGRRTMAV